jgi:hypothetical protein
VARVSDRDGSVQSSRQTPPPPPPPAPPAAAPPPPPDGSTGRFAKPETYGRQQGARSTVARVDHVEATLPALVAFCADGSWADGSIRITGTLTVFVESGQWKCCLTCRGTSRKAFVSAQTLQELLSRVDQGLDMDDLDWRRDGARRQ